MNSEEEVEAWPSQYEAPPRSTLMMVYDVIVSVAAAPQSGAAADTARLHLYTRQCLYPDAVL